MAIDGAPLDATRLAQLRAVTTWIDPQVHLFQATLFYNVCYGNGGDASSRMDPVIEDTRLTDVLQRLPDGFQTSLGEGGALVAGGEGQRVRIGRALARTNVRLAILDEPARGFDRDERQRFLTIARRQFTAATMFFITHDVADTLDFDRVVVLEHGRILEQGRPRALWADATSRYRALFDEDEVIQLSVWSHPIWRRVRMANGVLRETARARGCTSRSAPESSP